MNGEIIKTTPLLEIDIYEVDSVVDLKDITIGYIVKYRRDLKNYVDSIYIPISAVRKCKLINYFDISPQPQQKNDDLCDRLLKEIIVNGSGHVKREKVVVGDKAGFAQYGTSGILYSGIETYPFEIQEYLSESIRSNNRPMKKKKIYKNQSDYKSILSNHFSDYPELKIPFLIRITSYLQTFFAKYNIYCDQILVSPLNGMLDKSFWHVTLDNIKYGSNDAIMLSDKKSLKTAINTYNDSVLPVIDDTAIDDDSKREAGINSLQNKVLGFKKEFLQIPVLISNNVSPNRPDLYCFFRGLCQKYDISSVAWAELLELHDADFIEYIEKNSNNFIQEFNKAVEDISLNIPSSIPANRKNLYCMLATTIRMYNRYNNNFFDEKDKENLLTTIRFNYERMELLEEKMLKEFVVCLNSEISNNKFNFIKRSKYIIYNSENDSIIVDDNNVYFKTDTLKELAKNKLGLRNPNIIIGALKRNDCLDVNDKNSNCYRFHVQNSKGEPYMLYTYGISKKLINAENRKKFELADYQKFLFDYNELEKNQLLPLGITTDGRYIGKDVSFGKKSNDHIFITGQSGKGKSFCATNIIASLAMLGSRMLVVDVSESFTREEVLRALPIEVVDALFEFIEVASGKRKLPINPLFIGDCSGLPAKKRRIVAFIKAVAGKLDKEETRELTGIISDMLKRYPKVSSVTTDLLRNTLKRSGKTGHHVYCLISSTLDDIDNIGFEEQGWDKFFKKTKKIPVVSFGNESGDNVHSLLDAMISSAFEWQRDHDTAPLTVVVDEIKDQNFVEGSPLHTLLTQGRKFHIKFIGMTTQYISTSSHAIDVMKEAGIKIFFKPAKSLDRIAADLEYKNPADAGFGSMGIGDLILCCDCYNKVDGVNEHVVIHAKTIKFINTPLYEKFKNEYGIK